MSSTRSIVFARIVDATVELHRTLGPARTGISAIAERAGVQRHTFYRYFPDEMSVFKACSERYCTLNPLPDPRKWLDTADPRQRLRVALAEAYAYYGRNEAMMSNVLRDAEVMGPPIGTGFLKHREEMLAVLGRAWRLGRRRRRLLLAVLELALDFQTWRCLVRRGGLDDSEAIEVMVGLTDQAAGAVLHPRPMSRLALSGVPAESAGTLLGAASLGGDAVRDKRRLYRR